MELKNFTVGALDVSRLRHSADNGASLLQDEMEEHTQRINNNFCSMLHPDTPCRWWHKSYRAVPDAVSTVPLNEDILCERHLLWPQPAEEPGEPALPETTPTARPGLACPTTLKMLSWWTQGPATSPPPSA